MGSSRFVAKRSWGSGSVEMGNQGGRCLVLPPTLDTGTQVIQHRLALPSACFHYGENPFHKPTPLLTVRSSAHPSQQHSLSLRSLRLVVRRFYPLYFHKRPQPKLVPQQFLA